MHIRGQVMTGDCFECTTPGQPTPTPSPSPCVPVTKPQPQIWMLDSMPTPVSGCASAANAQALSWLTLTENGHNLTINVVHTLANASRITITQGQGGNALFEVGSIPPSMGQGSFPSLSQQQFDLMISDQGWLTISTGDCPNGALGGKIQIVQCPSVPVVTTLDGKQVVAPWTPDTEAVGLMAGAWNPSSHEMQMHTIVCMQCILPVLTTDRIP